MISLFSYFGKWNFNFSDYLIYVVLEIVKELTCHVLRWISYERRRINKKNGWSCVIAKSPESLISDFRKSDQLIIDYPSGDAKRSLCIIFRSCLNTSAGNDSSFFGIACGENSVRAQSHQ